MGDKFVRPKVKDESQLLELFSLFLRQPWEPFDQAISHSLLKFDLRHLMAVYWKGPTSSSLQQSSAFLTILCFAKAPRAFAREGSG